MNAELQAAIAAMGILIGEQRIAQGELLAAIAQRDQVIATLRAQATEKNPAPNPNPAEER